LGRSFVERERASDGCFCLFFLFASSSIFTVKERLLDSPGAAKRLWNIYHLHYFEARAASPGKSLTLVVVVVRFSLVKEKEKDLRVVHKDTERGCSIRSFIHSFIRSFIHSLSF
jgi:hypothetical protein